MNLFESLTLELARPGKRHGQLLSELTPYISLCEGTEADTVFSPFDHHTLPGELAGLRYSLGGNSGSEPVPNALRKDAVERLGTRVSELIGQMPRPRSYGVAVLARRRPKVSSGRSGS